MTTKEGREVGWTTPRNEMKVESKSHEKRSSRRGRLRSEKEIRPGLTRHTTIMKKIQLSSPLRKKMKIVSTTK